MRSVWCLVLPVFLGCSGQNVVAGQEQTKSEELAARLPAWCKSFCAATSECASNRPCDCSGEGCRCFEIDDGCASNCQKELLRYTGQGDACADLGERYRSCVDGLSCDEVFGTAAEDCEPTASERVVCPKNDDDDPPQSVPSGSGGSLATAGSAMIGHGTAGSAYGGGFGGATTEGGSTFGGTAPIPVGGSAPVDTFRCAESHSRGGAAGAAAHVVCEEARLECPDGHTYSWLCARSSSDELGCTCFKDGDLQSGFDPESNGCPSVAVVNAACGFRLAE